MAQLKAELERPLIEKNDTVIQIDTLAVLAKMENEEKFLEGYQTLQRIDWYEKAKYALPAIAGLAGTYCAGQVVANAFKMFSIPYGRILIHEARTLEQEYNDMRIENINSTCGELIPLYGSIQVNVFTRSPVAMVCIQRLNHNTTLNAFSSAYANMCNQSYPLSNYCTWPEVFNKTWSCINWAREILSHAPCFREYGLTGSKTTCRDLIDNIDTCSRLVPNLFLDNLKLRCGYFADVLCNTLADAAFNATLPGLNRTCEDLFISQEVFQTCHSTAVNLSNTTMSNYDQDVYEDRWWNEARTPWIIIGSLYFAVLIAALFVFKGGASWLYQKFNFNELSGADQKKINDAYVSVAEGDNEPLENLTIAEALGSYYKTGLQLKMDKQDIQNRRDCFLALRDDPDSIVPQQLDDTVANKILFFSGLYYHPPVEDRPEEDKQKDCSLSVSTI